MDILIVVLVFAVYFRFGYAVPNFGDNRSGFFWACVFAFSFGIFLFFTFQTLSTYVALAMIIGTIIGALIPMWKLGAFKKSGSIIDDGR